MKCGTVEVEMQREPAAVAVLIEARRYSGALVANHERRGVTFSDTRQTIRLSTADALAMLAWLQEQEPTLRAMVNEEAEALSALSSA